MSKLNITTTNGETFTYRQTCEMAHSIYLRFGRDLSASVGAWSRLMQNDTSTGQFLDLLQDYCVGSAFEAVRKVRNAA
jgi:hypothetical protein